MKILIKKLRNELIEHQYRITELKNAIDALQKVCDHKNEDGSNAFINDGRNSHYNYSACSICGTERKE